MRKNAKEVEVAARPLRIDRAMRQLHFARGVRERTILLVCGRSRQHDVRALRGLRQEHVVHDQQFEAGQTVGLRHAECLQGIRANYVKSLQFAGNRRFHHCAGCEARRGGNLTAPEFAESRTLG
jgi:hypothetical protein